MAKKLDYNLVHECVEAIAYFVKDTLPEDKACSNNSHESGDQSRRQEKYRYVFFFFIWNLITASLLTITLEYKNIWVFCFLCQCCCWLKD